LQKQKDGRCFFLQKNCEKGNIWTIFVNSIKFLKKIAFFPFYSCLILGVVVLLGVSVSAGSLLLLVG
jgi:hypothetical protein